MRRFLALLGKEVRSLLVSPVAAVAVALFLAASAAWFFFVADFFDRNVATLRDYFTIMPFVLIVIVSTITMRSWASEREQGTAELLRAAPLSDSALVISKYLSVVFTLVAMLLLSALLPWSVVVFGAFDAGVIGAQYVGMLLIGSAMAAVGLLMSVAATSQLVAFLTSALVLTGLLLVDEVGTAVDAVFLRSLLAALSFERNFYGFGRGIVDTRDLIFLLAVVGFSLMTAVFLLERPRRRRSAKLRYFFVMFIIALVVANSRFFYVRLDLTEDSQYTLSPTTLELIRAAEHPVRLTYVVSPRLYDDFSQPRAIEDTLNEYAARSAGRIEARVTDPEEVEEERLRELGLVPQQIQITEAGQQTIATVYSGITVEYLDRTESVPLIFAPEMVEYEVTSQLRVLVTDKRATVGFLAGASDRPIEQQLLFANTIASTFDIYVLDRGEPIPDVVDAVVATDASSLGPLDLLPLSRYLSRGGSALLTLERVLVDIEGNLEAFEVSGTAVRSLLTSYGISLGKELVLDRYHNQIPVQESSDDFSVNRLYPYPHWVSIREATTSAEHPITGRFTGLDLYWPTWLALANDAPAEAEIIAATSLEAWLMGEPFVTAPEAPGLASVPSSSGQYGVVAAYAGDERPGRLVAISDAGVFWDPLIQSTGSEHNVDFGLNALQWLTNDEELLSLRTRGARRVTLDAITDPARAASIQSFAITLNVILVPLMVLGAGLIFVATRYRRSIRSGSQDEE